MRFFDLHSPSHLVAPTQQSSPFLCTQALEHSSYLVPHRGSLSRFGDFDAPATPQQKEIYDALRTMVFQPSYPCVAAVKAFAEDDVRLGVYPSLSDTSVAECLALDLWRFIQEQKESESVYLTFVSVFESPKRIDDEHFEKLMWDQLQQLHYLSRRHYGWDVNAVSDPKDPKFCFSFAGEALFIVGLHSNSARKARRFQRPTMIFNLYRQFKTLQERNQYFPMQKTIRKRDVVFDGSINPMLTRFGENSEAIQYSGRDHETFWECPFKHD